MSPISEPNPIAAARGSARIHSVRTRCRACDAEGLEVFLSLGPQPLANAFLANHEEFASERHFPLDLCRCHGCGLVQLRDVIDPEVLFAHYLYVTGTSTTIAAHNRAYASHVAERLGLDERSMVVEVASNDGSLLRCFGNLGVRVLGVEPAANIAEIARGRGVPTFTGFFNSRTAADLRASEGGAQAVLANNVLAHVDDPRDFLAAARAMLAPGGRIVVEVPYALDMLNQLEYDTVYHEHLSYFSVSALSRLASAAGLCISTVERHPVHGGTIRTWFAEGAGDAPEVSALIADEDQLLSEACWVRFAGRVREHRDSVRAQFDRWHVEGRRVAGYGAPAKANTFLNYCDLGPDRILYTVDRNPLKVGRYTPGTHLPVLPATHLAADAPDVAVILAWNFADEIVHQQAAYARAGGRFFIAIPGIREISS